jgi:hypothetical protein
VTNPTLPNADELEAVAWRWPEPQREGGFLHSVTNVEPPCSGWEDLVTRSSAQAQIERLTRERDEAIDKRDGWKLQWEQEVKAHSEVASWFKDERTRAEAAEAEVKRLREALEPFAQWVQTMEANEFLSGSRFSHWSDEYKPVETVTVGDFRGARYALSGGTSNDR